MNIIILSIVLALSKTIWLIVSQSCNLLNRNVYNNTHNTCHLWSLIGFESESGAQPLVAAFSFHLAGREIFLPEAFVPTDYACCHIP